MNNIKKISLIVLLLSLYKVDGLFCSSAGADTVQTIEQRALTQNEEDLFKAVEIGDEVAVFNQLVDLNIQGPNGLTPLMQACWNGNVNIVRMLLRAGAKPNIESNRGSAMHIAAFKGFKDIVQILLWWGADLNQPDKDGDVPLMRACIHSDEIIVQMLLAAGAKPNAQNYKGQTAIVKASSLMDTRELRNIVRMLLGAGADLNKPDYKGRVPLMNACLYNNEMMVQMLLDAGAYPDAQDCDGRTAIMMTNSDEIVKKLLAAGANSNIQDKYGQTPLVVACIKNSLSIVQMLLFAGADPNAQTMLGTTSLVYALDNEHMARRLLVRGADSNTKDKREITALMKACARGVDNINVVKALLEAGACQSIRDVDGKTALDYCKDDALRLYLLTRIRC